MEEQTVSNLVQQPNIPTPPEPKHRSFLTNKLFLITLAIAVIFTIVYAGIYLYLGSQLDQISKPSPTPLPSETSVKEGDPTANWKTYTKTYTDYPLKLTFKYPQNYTFYEDTKFKPDSTYTGFFFSSEEQMGKFLNCPKLCDIYEVGLSIGIVSVPSFDKMGFSTSQYISASIDNKAALTKQYPFERGGLAKEIYVDLGDMILSMFTNAPENASKSPEESMRALDQILSTFKFTDQEDQVVCTQDARQCLDGSYVSRQPPTCEFAKCP